MKLTDEQIRKANRKGSRDGDLENATGFKRSRKIHKSNKTYTRKKKHR